MQHNQNKQHLFAIWPQLLAMLLELLRHLLPTDWRKLKSSNRPVPPWYLLTLLLLLSVVAGSDAQAMSLPALGEDNRPLVVFPREQITLPTISSIANRPVAGSAAGPVPGFMQEQLSRIPADPFAALTKQGSQYAAPGATVTYLIDIANYEATPMGVNLTETLPGHLAYIEGSATGGLAAAGNQLSWQGELEPGHLDYLVDETVALPYIDLADYGVGNLCDDSLAQGNVCQDIVVTINLGVNDYQTHLYGQPLYELSLSANGLILVSGQDSNQPTSAHNQLLPDQNAPGHLLAGLWRHNRLGTPETGPTGRWHAAILAGWINGQDVFYAQWHNAPHADDRDLTVRHAIALILGDGPNSGEIFYLYDNISDPIQQIAAGYTIGLEDKLGSRGLTWAYAACCGEPAPPIGLPPLPGTTLRLVPTLFGGHNAYSHQLSYQVRNNAPVPELVTTTVRAVTDSADPALAFLWSTYHLHSRLQAFLPILGNESLGGTP